jgi:hypothetical protein
MGQLIVVGIIVVLAVVGITIKVLRLIRGKGRSCCKN